MCSFFFRMQESSSPNGCTKDVNSYPAHIVKTHCTASDDMSDPFMRYMATADLGKEKITRGEYLNAGMRTYEHLHIWDFDGIAAALRDAGFTDIKRAPYRDSEDPNDEIWKRVMQNPTVVWAQPCDLVVECDDGFRYGTRYTHPADEVCGCRAVPSEIHKGLTLG